MAGFWSIVVPEATINWALNPSAELAGNFAAVSASTVTRVTTHARFGVYSYFVDCSSTNDGISLTLSALANAIHNVTFYLRAATTITGNIQVSLDAGANYNTATRVNGDSSIGWARYNVQISAAQSSGSTGCLIRNTLNEDFYIDGVQIETKTGYYTTYCDGDIAGCRWDGLRHAGKSSRDVQYRLGGRIRNLDDYGIYARRGEFSDVGMPPAEHVFFQSANGAGAIYQGTRTLTRSIQIVLEIEGTTWYDLHAKRQDLLSLIENSQHRNSQPFRLLYHGANSSRFVYSDFRYEAGMNFSNDKGFAEQPILRCIAENPYWYEDDRQAAALSTSGGFAPARVYARINNAWGTLGTGFDNTVRACAIHEKTGRIFFGGDFTTANGVTVNGVTYWNPTTSTFVAMGAGTPGVSGGSVYAIVVLPNGDAWIGGTFTGFNAGGTATHGIVRWNSGANTFTAFALAAGSQFFALDLDSDGNLFAGGDFLNWNADANQDYITKYSTLAGTWAALGTGMNGIVRAIRCVDSTHVYVAGQYTTGNGVTINRVGYWNATTFVAMGTGADATMRAIVDFPNGDVIYGGDCTTLNGESITRIGRWQGSAWTALASGLSGTGVNALAIDGLGRLLVGGSFAVVDAITGSTPNFSYFNGTKWLPTEITGTMTVHAIAVSSNGDVYIVHTKTSTANVGAQTTISNRSTTAVNPRIALDAVDLGAGGTTVLCVIENQTTNEWSYFDYRAAHGDHVLTISFEGNESLLVSEWYGKVYGQPLPGSDKISLLPGSNTLFVYFPDIGDFCVISWPVVHASVDGVA